MTIATLFILLFGCMLIGMPIALSLGFASIVTILLFSNDSLASIALKLFEALSTHYTLLAIPFFILSSAFLSTGGVARRLIRFATDLVGHIRGGQRDGVFVMRQRGAGGERLQHPEHDPRNHIS